MQHRMVVIVVAIPASVIVPVPDFMSMIVVLVMLFALLSVALFLPFLVIDPMGVFAIVATTVTIVLQPRLADPDIELDIAMISVSR